MFREATTSECSETSSSVATTAAAAANNLGEKWYVQF
jgi:hypothetical protein